jgi:Tfp pilus assembly protein PilX
MRVLTRDERGSALVIAMLALLILTILAGAVLETALQSRQQSTQNRGRQGALAAANAGLSAAEFRLSQYAGADPTQCFTTQNAGPPVAGVCAAFGPASAGNGENYTYYVSPALSQSDSCAGLWVQAPSGQTIVQRCITAIGTAHGEKARVQVRVAGYQLSSQFPVNGILALNSFTTSGTFSVNGDIGSNGNVSGSGSFAVQGTVYYVPPATVTAPCTLPSCTKTPQSTAYGVPATSDGPYQASASSNDNASIAWPSGVYDPVKRTVVATNKVGTAAAPLVIPSGTYNFCRFQFNNDTYLTLAPGGHVHIYIDSPARSGSGCASGTGDVSVTGKLDFENPSGDPTALQIEAYGNPGGTPTTFKLNNALNSSSSPFTGTIFAPNSAFTTTNVFSMNGAIVANTFTSSNSVAFTAGNLSGLASGSAIQYAPAAWQQCRSAPTANPTAAC